MAILLIHSNIECGDPGRGAFQEFATNLIAIEYIPNFYDYSLSEKDNKMGRKLLAATVLSLTSCTV